MLLNDRVVSFFEGLQSSVCLWNTHCVSHKKYMKSVKLKLRKIAKGEGQFRIEHKKAVALKTSGF
jgi:hypothetical protein